MIFKIPARSPDLNPIENFFNIMVKELNKQAIEKKITKESFEEFSNRIKQTMLTYPIQKIDKIIESMDNRINMILKNQGHRIKY